MRALISVSDKTGVVDFARELVSLGWEILYTSGTMRMLREAGLPVTSVSDVTGFPEICDGRVKTLHPKIHGALLARRDIPDHLKQLEDNGIEKIDLVCVNLYPFRETIAKPDVTMEDAVEHIDIGGPSMLRSAAKNWASVTVVVNPEDYATVISEIKATGDTTPQTRLQLSAKAYTSSDSKNPRCALGMVEPGHYVAILAEGRLKRSGGITVGYLAKMMREKGCVNAFNLDGGQTAVMVFMGKQLNQIGKYDGKTNSRPTSEVLGIGTSDQVGVYEVK